MKTKQTFKVAIALPPVPASRPRVSRFGTYYGKNYAIWKNKADALLRKEKFPSTNLPLQVHIEQVCKLPKTTKRTYPIGDVDNHAKGVLDAITRSDFGWEDDAQIIELNVTKRFAHADEEARSIVKWKVIQNL